jgi:hypothetical protein
VEWAIALDWAGLVSLDAASKGESGGGGNGARAVSRMERERAVVVSVLRVEPSNPAPRTGLLRSPHAARWTSPAQPLTPAAKLILISKNCPPLRKSELEYYAML